MDIQPSSERVYALDALRAIMMLLGLVIHAAVTYDGGATNFPWPLKDPSGNAAFGLVVHLIHSFRMPVFFVAAGFFGALLLYKKGPKAMLTNRIKRILFPFLVGVLVIWPLIMFAFAFSKNAMAGEPAPIKIALDKILTGKFILSYNVAHLWFLYFLIMFAVLAWLLATLFKKKTAFTEWFDRTSAFVLQNFWLRFLGIGMLLFVCLYWMGTGSIKTNNMWSIDPATFITYFIFFGTGWMIYRTNTLDKLKQYPLWQLGIALLLFFVSVFISGPEDESVHMAEQALSAVYGSLFIFGFIAFFLTYFNHYSPRLNYIMDAAYWVYIIHLPIVAFIPGLLAGLSLPGALKFFLTLLATTLICLATYKYFVRGTFIGMFLNGKVYKKQKDMG